MIRVLCLGVAAIALASQGLADDQPRITARTLKKDGAIVRGTGQVKISLGELLLQGHEGSVNSSIDEMSVQGGATAQLPPKTSTLLIRLGSHAVVTPLPVVLKADRITVKDGLLRAKGHIHLEAGERVLDGDSLDCFLNIGDGTLSGNVRENGWRIDNQRTDRRGVFILSTPEVIK